MTEVAAPPSHRRLPAQPTVSRQATNFTTIAYTYFCQATFPPAACSTG